MIFPAGQRVAYETGSREVEITGIGTRRSIASSTVQRPSPESVVYSLVQVQGAAGKKALILYTDGADEDEDFPYETAQRFARRVGVPIYFILTPIEFFSVFVIRPLSQLPALDNPAFGITIDGLTALMLVVVTSVFIGMVMSTQFAFGLQKFGGMEYTSRVVALSFARELAPTLTAVIVGGRIGAGMTAELGSMAVTEQIDAIQALGADPVKKLVMPRLVAAIIIMPILGTFALVLGFSGAMFITDWQFNIPASFFLSSALQTMQLMDYFAGLIKTPFFGAIIAIVGCHFGMRTRGGTAGVAAAGSGRNGTDPARLRETVRLLGQLVSGWHDLPASR